MIKITAKTLTDLEFPKVCAQVSHYTVTDPGKERTLEIKPYPSYEKTVFALYQTNEYVSSFQQESPIPNHGFDPIDQEIKLLGIEDAVLEAGSIRKVASISETVNSQIKFFNKFLELYPSLHETVTQVELTNTIIDRTSQIIDRFGNIKDEASPLLQELRRKINKVKGDINSSFGKALTHYQSLGYLDDIRETVVENIRVLAVSAMHRRKVKGGILGNSKTGSIVYIQPEATYIYTRELNNLEYEEKEEIKRILKELTNFLRPFRPLLREYQELLTDIDVISAKAKYARELKAILPKITKERELQLKDAYHPILLLNNRKKGEKTFPQTIELHKENRIIVISGPNAGEKVSP